MNVRLAHMLDSGLFTLPEDGNIVVFGAGAGHDLSALPAERVTVVCRVKPDFDQMQAAGIDVTEDAPDTAAIAVVFLPRAKKQARAMVARAIALAETVIIDGQKTDGVDSVLREMRKRATCSEPYAKAHGKIFVASAAADGAFTDWAEGDDPRPNRDGFVTTAGVFSADGIDPASRLLAEALVGKVKGRIADFGAGWGYLAAEILKLDSVTQIDLVEADNAALECARTNVRDPRARFHWADATLWTPEALLDCVVMNPPFHTGRKGVPELGQAFIRNAAKCLSPGGRLYLVANRHLPYEGALSAAFRDVREIGGDNRFKLFAAARPSRPGR